MKFDYISILFNSRFNFVLGSLLFKLVKMSGRTESRTTENTNSSTSASQNKISGTQSGDMDPRGSWISPLLSPLTSFRRILTLPPRQPGQSDGDYSSMAALQERGWGRMDTAVSYPR